jgi:hypothetical protein
VRAISNRKGRRQVELEEQETLATGGWPDPTPLPILFGETEVTAEEGILRLIEAQYQGASSPSTLPALALPAKRLLDR